MTAAPSTESIEQDLLVIDGVTFGLVVVGAGVELVELVDTFVVVELVVDAFVVVELVVDAFVVVAFELVADVDVLGALDVLEDVFTAGVVLEAAGAGLEMTAAEVGAGVAISVSVASVVGVDDVVGLVATATTEAGSPDARILPVTGMATAVSSASAAAARVRLFMVGPDFRCVGGSRCVRQFTSVTYTRTVCGIPNQSARSPHQRLPARPARSHYESIQPRMT